MALAWELGWAPLLVEPDEGLAVGVAKRLRPADPEKGLGESEARPAAASNSTRRRELRACEEISDLPIRVAQLRDEESCWAYLRGVRGRVGLSARAVEVGGSHFVHTRRCRRCTAEAVG